MKLTKILLFIALCIFSGTSWAMKQQALIIPQNIIEQSNYIKNLRENLLKEEIYIPNLTQQELNLLDQFYQNTQSKDVTNNQLVSALNTETFLDMKTPNQTLENIFIERLKTEKLKNLKKAILELNPNRANELMFRLIKEEKIDINLIEPYQKTLPIESIKLPADAQDGETTKILFFNDDILIYGIHIKNINSPLLTHFKRLIVKNKINNIKRIIFEEQNEVTQKTPLVKRITISPNGSFCMLERQVSSVDRFGFFTTDPSFTSLNCIDQTQSPKFHPIKNNNYWCFASDEVVCSIDTDEKNITLLNLKTNGTQSYQFPESLRKKRETETHMELSRIDKIACQVKDNDLNNAVIIITTTNQTSPKGPTIENDPQNIKTFLDIHIIKKDTALKVNYSLTSINKIKELIINHSGKVAYVSANHLYSIDVNSKQPTLSRIIPYGPAYIKSSKSDALLISFYWPENEPLYSFTIPSTGNNWLRGGPQSSAIVSISHNGKEAIEISRGIFSPSENLITLYDENMTKTLNYLDTTKTDVDETPQQTKLLVTLLIHHIIKNHNKLNSKIILDPVESEIYKAHTPLAIKNILEEKYRIVQKKTDQNILKSSSFSDLFSSFGENIRYYRALALDKFNQMRARLTKSSVTLPKKDERPEEQDKINFETYKISPEIYKVNPAHE